MQARSNRREDYPFCLIWAILIHVVVLLVVFLSFDFSTRLTLPPPPGLDVQPIQAVAIMRGDSPSKITLPPTATAPSVKEEAKPTKVVKPTVEQKKEVAPLPSEKVIAERKQAEKALAEKKLAEEKRMEQVQAEKKLTEKKLAEKKLAEKKLTEKKLLEKKLAEKKLAEKKLAEQALAKEVLAKEKLAQKKAAHVRQVALQNQLAKQLQQEQAAMQGDPNSKQAANIVNEYASLIKQAVGNDLIRPVGAPDTAVTRLLITLTANGTVINVSVTKSSGNDAFDRAGIAAVYKASPLPVPKDADIFDHYFRHFYLTTPLPSDG